MPQVPDAQTSNYGWAIWHLHMAYKAHDEDMVYHLGAAQARATLAHADMVHGGPPGPSTWPEGNESDA
jgi:hypothetical protein